ncbi:MAG: hypothetical protein AB1634_00770 [Thermodesulfobacteriota bacterium]
MSERVENAPSRPSPSWPRVWLVALLLAGTALIGWEGYWRGQGFRPTVEDDAGIWGLVRRQASRTAPAAIVLVGASRIQLAVDPALVTERTTRPCFMLAIDGSPPWPVLADLAQDPSFAGLVLCSLLPQWLADAGSEKGRAAKWVRKADQATWADRLNTRLGVWCQSRLVFRYPGLQPGRVWAAWADGAAPRPPYAPMRLDRFRAADFAAGDRQRLAASRAQRQEEMARTARPLDPSTFAERLTMIGALAGSLHGRGGQVVFVRLPSDGRVRELEEATWPRQRYWDELARSGIAPALHYADHPSLAGFRCPDGSHLDGRDAGPFTAALLQVLAEEGLLDLVQPGQKEVASHGRGE